MRLQAACLAEVHLLRGEQQVHRQRTTQTADHDEDLAELRLGHEHFRELVQDDEQGGQRRELVLAGDAVRLVFGDVRVVARLAQDLLAAHHFALQGVLHTVDEGELRLQVRDHGRHVRQVRHAGEGRATLEVDENQVQLLRGVGESQGQHEGTQHLGLTRTGRADQQAVGTHTMMGGFLDVQDDRRSLGRDAEGGGEAFAALAATPLLLRIEVADVADADELHEVLLAGLVRTAHRGVRLFQVLLRGERRHSARDGLRLHGAQAIRESLLGHGVHGDHVDHVRTLVIRVRVDEQTQRRV